MVGANSKKWYLCVANKAMLIAAFLTAKPKTDNLPRAQVWG